jgi:hypothetical protein
MSDLGSREELSYTPHSDRQNRRLLAVTLCDCHLLMLFLSGHASHEREGHAKAHCRFHLAQPPLSEIFPTATNE